MQVSREWWKSWSSFLFVYVGVSVLLVGSAHKFVAASLCLLLGCLALVFRRGISVPASAPALLCVAGALWSLLSIVPLPLGALRSIDPQSAEWWATSLVPVSSTAPTWVPVSLDVGATWLEVAKWSSYGLLTLLSASAARSRNLNAVLLAIWGTAVLCGVTTVLQQTLGLSKVLGVYSPEALSPQTLASPLVNPNNLSGYLNMGLFCGLALLASQRRPFGVAPLALGSVLCLAVSVFSGSRGGVGCLLAGSVFVVPQLVKRKRRRPVNAAGLWALPAVLMGGLGLVLVGLRPALSEELLGDDYSKLSQLERLWPAIQDHGILGVGRGAFETVAHFYLPQEKNVVWRQVENFALSWVVEWGMGAGLLMLGGLAWLLRPERLRLTGYAPAQIAWIGLMVFLGQNLVDLGLEVFAPSAAFFVLLGALDGSREERGEARRAASGRARRGHRSQPGDRLGGEARVRARRQPRRLVVPLAAALSLLGGGMAWASGEDVYSVRQQLSVRLERAIAGTSGEARAFQAQLEREMRARPAEPYYRLAGGVFALSQNQNAIPWAAAALERAPKIGRVHFVLAQALQKRGAISQALLELRLAVTYEPQLARDAGQLAASWTWDLESLLRSAPSGKPGNAMLLGAAQRLPDDQRPLTRRKLLEHATEHSPGEGDAAIYLGMALLEDLTSGKTPCLDGGRETRCPLTDRADLVEQVRDTIQRVPASASCPALTLEARLLEVEGDQAGALRKLSDCGACEDPQRCARLKLQLLQKVDDVDARVDAERLFLGHMCETNEKCAEGESLLGKLASARGDSLSSHAHFYRAAMLAPSVTYWLSAARAAARSRQLRKAELCYDRAVALGAEDESVRELIESARSELFMNNREE